MKIKFATLLLSLAFIISCGDDDNTAADYIGTWVATNIDITLCDDPLKDNFSSVQCNTNSCYKITFTDSLTYSFQRVREIENGTYSASGVNISLCRDNEGEQICDAYVGTITSSGLRFAITSEDGCNTAYIMERLVEDNM